MMPKTSSKSIGSVKANSTMACAFSVLFGCTPPRLRGCVSAMSQDIRSPWCQLVKKKAAEFFRQPGYLIFSDPVALRPHFAMGLPFRGDVAGIGVLEHRPLRI